MVTAAGGGALRVTVANTTKDPIKAGVDLVTFAIRSAADSIAELGETFRVSLTSAAEPVGLTSWITTTIVNRAGFIGQSTDSDRWLALSGDRLTFDGIGGTELRSITVATGDQANDVQLADAVAFATLDTGHGDERVSALVEPIRDDSRQYVQFGHVAYRATISTGEGGDIVTMQSADNVRFVRESPQASPGYEMSDY